MRVTTRRGLDVAVSGAPRQQIDEAPRVSSVAVIADDYRLHRPTVLRSVGDRVRCGERLIEDRGSPGAVVTSPASGVVSEIELGEKRALRSVVIALDDTEEEIEPIAPRRGDLQRIPRDDVVRTLIDGGLWPALRTRPFHRVAAPETPPRSIFVTATDSEPLAPSPDIVIAEQAHVFADGLAALAKLTDGPVYLCTASAGGFTGVGDRITVVEFAGPHPSGLVGTHIHFLDPVVNGKVVWHVGYQDVIAIGHLMTTGRHWVERVIALAGPSVKRPRLLRTRLGASIVDLVRNELDEGAYRVISGSVLAGRQASGWGRHLGRFHRQVCVLPEPDPVAAGQELTTARHGRPGPMIPTEDFERVLPLDLLPTPLLRALVVGDDDAAHALGCLELDEEDLALCTYVCPGKLEYGPLLTRALARIEAGR